MGFIFTGSLCDPEFDGCVDFGNETASSARITFGACDGSVDLSSSVASSGESVFVGGQGVCLPDCLTVSISNPADPSDEGQTFTIDSSCAGRELVLSQSYGALDFAGYSCDSDDVAITCLQEIVYNVGACNIGTEDLTVYDLTFDYNGDVDNLLESESQLVAPGECIDTVITEAANRCLDAEYTANVIMNATNPVTNVPYPCEDEEELAFAITVPTFPPTPAPSPFPTPSSPAPTGECNLDVQVAPECPLIECGFDRCRERPFRMLFRVDTRPCADSILKRCPGQDPGKPAARLLILSPFVSSWSNHSF